MAVLAPMPNAKERMAAAVKPGLRPSIRKVYRTVGQKSVIVISLTNGRTHSRRSEAAYFVASAAAWVLGTCTASIRLDGRRSAP